MSIVNDPDLLADVQSAFGSQASRAEQDLELPSSSPVTDDEDLLAEIDAAFAKENRQQTLYNVVDSDVETDKPTWADWVSPTLSITSSLALAGKGFRQGQQVASSLPLPPQLQAPARAIGGVVGSALYTVPLVFASEYAGNNIEDLVEGREINPDRAFQEAVDAAQTDAAIQFALPIVGQSLKIAGKGTVEASKKALGYGKARLTSEQIEKIIDFQRRLKAFDPKATLTPAGASGGKSLYQNWITSVGAVSAFTRGQINNLVNTYDHFMGKQLDNVIQQFKGATPFQQGKAIQTFVNQVDMAIDDIVAPMYKSIEAAGKGVNVNPTEIGKELYEGYLSKYRGAIKTNKKGEPILDDLGNVQRNTAYPSGDIKTAVEELKNLPDDLTFFEAHKRLSMIKSRLYKAQTTMSPTPQQNELIDILKKTKDMYEGAMDDAAENMSPALKKEYEQVTSFYKQGKSKVQQSYLKRALEVNDPSEVGALLTKEGAELPVQQLKSLMEFAESIKYKKGVGYKRKTALGGDPLSRLRKGYLESLFKVQGEGGRKSIDVFKEKMKEPKFRATFNTLFKDTDVPKKMDDILEDLDIVDTAIIKGQGMQLSIASAEIGLVQGQKNFLEKFRDLFPTFMAIRGIKQKSIDSYLDTLKVIAEAQKTGSKIPKEYLMRIQTFEKIAQAGAVGGATVSTM